jgi:Uma2 family endonuclease
MTAVPKRKLTEAEYLEIERAAEFKSEFFNGEMFPMQGPGGPLGMAGATFAHNAVKENLSNALGNVLRGGPCRTLSSGMKVKVPATGLYTYPDILVVCGQPQFPDEKSTDVLLNPAVIVEVLSPATEKYDRGAKFRQYQQLPSLKEYILVAQDESVCERFVRQADNSWLLTTVTGLESHLAFATVDASVPLAEIYFGVTFPDKPIR